jgi:hypothetical protein
MIVVPDPKATFRFTGMTDCCGQAPTTAKGDGPPLAVLSIIAENGGGAGVRLRKD